MYGIKNLFVCPYVCVGWRRKEKFNFQTKQGSQARITIIKLQLLKILLTFAVFKAHYPPPCSPSKKPKVRTVCLLSWVLLNLSETGLIYPLEPRAQKPLGWIIFSGIKLLTETSLTFTSWDRTPENRRKPFSASNCQTELNLGLGRRDLSFQEGLE